MHQQFILSATNLFAFIYGVLRILIENGWHDQKWIDAHSVGFDELREHAMSFDWPALEQQSGLPRAAMQEFAEILRDAKNAIALRGGTDLAPRSGLRKQRKHTTIREKEKRSRMSFPKPAPIDSRDSVRGGKIAAARVAGRRGMQDAFSRQHDISSILKGSCVSWAA